MKPISLQHSRFLYLFTAFILFSCTKDPDIPNGGIDPGGGTGGGGTGGGSGGVTTSSITFVNPTPSPLQINFNGTSKIAPVGGTAIFTDQANKQASGEATGKGDVINGYSLGLMLSWPLNLTFPPAGGNLDYTLDVGPEYFFLKIKNVNTDYWRIYSLSVNGQAYQSVDIPANGTVYNIGYFQAYTNSTIYARPNNSSGSYWHWSNLSLPFIKNQSFMAIAN